MANSPVYVLLNYNIAVKKILPRFLIVAWVKKGVQRKSWFVVSGEVVCVLFHQPRINYLPSRPYCANLSSATPS